MMKKKTFNTAGPVRTSLDLAIVILLAGCAAFGATDAAAHGQGQEGQQGQDGHKGQVRSRRGVLADIPSRIQGLR